MAAKRPADAHEGSIAPNLEGRVRLVRLAFDSPISTDMPANFWRARLFFVIGKSHSPPDAGFYDRCRP